MTWAIKPHPMTPTLSRPAIFTPRFEYAGTFHRPYRKPCVVSTPGAHDHLRGLGYALLRVDERVLVLDRDRIQAAALFERNDEASPPRRIAPAADHREVPRHRLGWARPAAVEQSVDGKVLRSERDVLAVAVTDRVTDRVHHG